MEDRRDGYSSVHGELGLRRTSLLVLLINIYGIGAAGLALLGLIRPPIIMTFVITPFLVNPLQRLWANPRYRWLSLVIMFTIAIGMVTLTYLVLTNL